VTNLILDFKKSTFTKAIWILKSGLIIANSLLAIKLKKPENTIHLALA
jgi:hypothetical protein